MLVPPDGNMHQGKPPGWENGLYQHMCDKLTTDRGRELYAQRKITIETVFGCFYEVKGTSMRRLKRRRERCRLSERIASRLVFPSLIRRLR